MLETLKDLSSIACRFSFLSTFFVLCLFYSGWIQFCNIFNALSSQVSFYCFYHFFLTIILLIIFQSPESLKSRKVFILTVKVFMSTADSMPPLYCQAEVSGAFLFYDKLNQEKILLNANGIE